MKGLLRHIFMVGVMLMFAASSMTIAIADEKISYNQVASSGEMSAVETVQLPGMKAVMAGDVEEGEYDITVKSSSKMFRVEKAVLTVKDGKMQAVMTMGGKGYLKIYMGTGLEAAAADQAEYIDFDEDSQGKHTFTVPVETLDKGLSCAAFSKNKEKWYDRQILFEAGSLPKGAVKVELPDYEALEKAARDARIEAIKAENAKKASASAEPVAVDMGDGEYTVDAALAGGSGKATIASPAILVVRDGKAYIKVEWSSPNYDYMLMGEKKFLPINTDGNSVFELPVTTFNEPMSVIADTVAMSVPHEIEYTITVDSATIKAAGGNRIMIVAAAVLAVAVAAIFIFIKRKKDKNE